MTNESAYSPFMILQNLEAMELNYVWWQRASLSAEHDKTLAWLSKALSLLFIPQLSSSPVEVSSWWGYDEQDPFEKKNSSRWIRWKRLESDLQMNGLWQR